MFFLNVDEAVERQDELGSDRFRIQGYIVSDSVSIDGEYVDLPAHLRRRGGPDPPPGRPGRGAPSRDAGGARRAPGTAIGSRVISCSTNTMRCTRRRTPSGWTTTRSSPPPGAIRASRPPRPPRPKPLREPDARRPGRDPGAVRFDRRCRRVWRIGLRRRDERLLAVGPDLRRRRPRRVGAGDRRHGAGADHPRFHRRLRGRQRQLHDPGAVQRRHPLGLARGLDPAVGAGAGRLHRCGVVEVPGPHHRPDGGLGAAGDVRRRASSSSA